MNYNELNWSSDWMYSEIMGLDYGEVEDDFAVGLYSLKSFPDVYMYINTETGKVLEVWLEDDEDKNLCVDKG